MLTLVGSGSVTAAVLTRTATGGGERRRWAALTLPSCRVRPRRRAVPFQGDTSAGRPHDRAALPGAAAALVVDLAAGPAGRSDRGDRAHARLPELADLGAVRS